MTVAAGAGVACSEEGRTLLVTLDRPGRRNALDGAALAALLRAIRGAARPGGARAVVITGAGPAFCSGQDLDDPLVRGERPDLGLVLERGWNPVATAVRDSPRPVVAAVNGPAAGAGVALALACDLAFASPGASFHGGFPRLGLAPDAGSSALLARGLGHARAMAFLLLGEPLRAADLLAAGLVNAVSDDPLARAMEAAGKAAALPPEALALAKGNLRSAAEDGWRASLAREASVQRHLGAQDGYREGLAAFLGKREPKF